MPADLGGTAKTVPFRVNLDLIPVAVNSCFPKNTPTKILELMLMGAA
jgi:hypothetical protein